MKLIAAGVLLLCFFLSGLALADNTPPILSNVSYQLTEQQWVNTSKATAIISVSASISDQNVATLRSSIMSKLQKLAAGKWHITQFTRSKTNSGLESVNVMAQIRLPANQLNQIYGRVKSISKAGETYKVANMNFNPSPEDILAAQKLLRQKIYSDVQQEVESLNKQYTGQKYFVRQIRFIASPSIMPRALVLAKVSGNAAMPSVSQQVTLTAEVELSSQIHTQNNGS